MRKPLVSVKTYRDVYDKKKQLSFELSLIEKKKVSIPEVDRRILNIKDLPTILKTDSLLFKRKYEQ